MSRYYFDLRDDHGLVPDEEGMEMKDLDAVQDEAARALAGFAWDAMRNATRVRSDKMSIEVRDHIGQVMEVKFFFEIIRKQ